MNKTLLHISLISGVGPAVVQHILDTVAADVLHVLYEWRTNDFVQRLGCTQRIAHKLVEGLADHVLLEKEIEQLIKHDIQCITIDEVAYPSLLRQIYLPPTVLYCRGAFPATMPCISFVGARKANHYAKRVLSSLVPPVVEAGQAIVSGGAIGADAMAHAAAQQAGGTTYAVIGSGLLQPYPASNRRLFEEIVAAGGAVLSPFSLSTQALPGNFPARNRIIAGLSTLTIVVQAAQRSGALITARFALEQGREIGAVPGDIADPLSAGCHALLQEGAHPITNAQDVLTLCGAGFAQATQATSSESCLRNEVQRDPVILACRCPRTLDELLDELGIEYAELHKRLLDLQMQGMVEQDFLGRWLSK